MIYHGNCLDILKGLEANSIDSVVTDPPYGLAFMGKRWDYDVPSQEIWAECLRVLKPGGHLLAFAGTRTQHRMAVRIEDAGFEIRDMIAWVYGSGFPKSLDVSKAIDKAAGVERGVLGVAGKSGSVRNSMVGDFAGGEYRAIAPATEAAIQWQGWGTALKPALEPITVARKPLSGTVAENVLAHGTGALNVDGCRVGDGTETGGEKPVYVANNNNRVYGTGMGGGKWENTTGRWPANLIHDGSEEVAELFPVTKPSKKAARGGTNPNPMDWGCARVDGQIEKGHNGNGGSAARFFYCAKASKRDRGEGNNHPTVKPTNLMRYLCRLVTPPGGTVLDPFMGSGSTAVACMAEGFKFIGCELNLDYIKIAYIRLFPDL